MAIFVNYYPCSYGDSLVSMFSNLGIQRENNLITTPVNYFKFTNTIYLPEEQKIITLNNEQKERLKEASISRRKYMKMQKRYN